MCVFYLRCQPRARRTAGVPPTPQNVQQESASCWMAVDAVKCVHGSSLRTAARNSHVTTQRDWSATLEGDTALLRASVEVQSLSFSSFLMNLQIFSHFKPFCFSKKQPNQTEEHASTATRSTRTGRSSVQTANTSARAWTVLWDVSRSAHISSRCPNWAVPSPRGSRYRDGAVSNSSAPRRRRRRALW